MMKWISYSGKGLRPQNEDCVFCKSLGDTSVLLMIADGMGGYECGAESAKIVVDTISNVLEHKPTTSISTAVTIANGALATFKKAKRLHNTGCTLAGVRLEDGKAQVFWAGDSRVYIIRNNQVVYETQDHSLINEMKKTKVLTADQIERYEHIVRRAIMGDESDSVDTEVISLCKGDEILVCSDGLYRGLPLNLALSKLRNEGDSFCVDDEKFDDNHSLIYYVV